MTTFYFNTGVKPQNVTNWPGLFKGQILRDGTIQIPFDCDVPDNAVFQFACNSGDLPEGKYNGWLVTDIKQPSGMMSKYAYFTIR